MAKDSRFVSGEETEQESRATPEQDQEEGITLTDNAAHVRNIRRRAA